MSRESDSNLNNQISNNRSKKHDRMANILLLVSLLVIPVVVTMAGKLGQPKGTIRWEENLNSALTTAGEDNKLVLVNFTASWCKACSFMENQILPEAKVEKAIKGQFVPVKIDFSSNPELAEKYKIDAIPAFLVLDSHGREVERLIGASPSDSFIRWLSQFSSTAYLGMSDR